MHERPKWKNLSNLAASLAPLADEQIISGLDFKQEVNLIQWSKELNKEAALDYKPMLGYKDKDLLFKVILAATTWFVEGFKEGARMRTSDIYRFGLYLAEYRVDSLEDVILCFKLAEAEDLRDPETGQKIKRYASMNYELLIKYWHAYLDSKAGLRELRRSEQKYKENGGDFRTEEDTRIAQLERNKEFVKDFKNASNQVQRWENSDNVTPLQAVFTQKFGERK
jgi:hypothetical protein